MGGRGGARAVPEEVGAGSCPIRPSPAVAVALPNPPGAAAAAPAPLRGGDRAGVLPHRVHRGAPPVRGGAVPPRGRRRRGRGRRRRIGRPPPPAGGIVHLQPQARNRHRPVGLLGLGGVPHDRRGPLPEETQGWSGRGGNCWGGGSGEGGGGGGRRPDGGGGGEDVRGAVRGARGRGFRGRGFRGGAPAAAPGTRARLRPSATRLRAPSHVGGAPPHHGEGSGRDEWRPLVLLLHPPSPLPRRPDGALLPGRAGPLHPRGRGVRPEVRGHLAEDRRGPPDRGSLRPPQRAAAPAIPGGRSPGVVEVCRRGRGSDRGRGGGGAWSGIPAAAGAASRGGGDW